MAHQLNKNMQDTCAGNAYVSVNKAVVTQASSAYLLSHFMYLCFLLQCVKSARMKDVLSKQTACSKIVYMVKSFPELDEVGRIRLDDWEMDEKFKKQSRNCGQLCIPGISLKQLILPNTKGILDYLVLELMVSITRKTLIQLSPFKIYDRLIVVI